jgi:GrpB-like predicted nucleotidyltransferase (UPF0157 family)
MAGVVRARRDSDSLGSRRARRPDRARWFDRRSRGLDTKINLDVFSTGCEGIETMLGFRDHLRANASDRELYTKVNRELAARDWQCLQQYADSKTTVVGEILALAGR